MKVLKFFLPVLLMISMVSSAHAIGSYPIYDQPVQNLVGSVSVAGGGIKADGQYSGLVLNWEIAQAGDVWVYKYTFSSFTKPAISHFILDLSDTCVSPGDPKCIQGITQSYIFGTYTGFSPSNPGMPESITGVKFEFGGEGPYTYIFSSDRPPVYGDFYVAGGIGQEFMRGYAYNTGIDNHESSYLADFIPRPDGGNQVPEPAVLLLLGGGLVAVAIWGFRRRKKKA